MLQSKEKRLHGEFQSSNCEMPNQKCESNAGGEKPVSPSRILLPSGEKTPVWASGRHPSEQPCSGEKRGVWP